MRNILFRGKRSGYGGWVEGCLVIDVVRNSPCMDIRQDGDIKQKPLTEENAEIFAAKKPGHKPGQ